MDKDHLDELLKKYGAGTCNEEERQAVEKWYASYDNEGDQARDTSLTGQQDHVLYSKIVNKLRQEGEWDSNKKNILSLKRRVFRWVAAAAIIVLLGGSFYFWSSSKKSTDIVLVNKNENRFKNDIEPGGNKAVLELADGSQLILDNQQNGTIAQQGNMNVIKLNSGQVSYDKKGDPAEEVFYNTLSTPRGGQYQIILPDGSKAWLNASSSLRFPTAFNGKERVVELTGEGYFEITRNKSMPFKVKADEMTVEVLGTHFNVMAYANEQSVKTTLLEGLVKVSGKELSSFLKPGQQAAFLAEKNTINITSSDTEEAVAWKNKLFWFHDADIKTVMRQIERWYDVEVVFEATVTKKFKGSIPMDLSAIKVFNILEQTGGVHFRIDGKRIYVLP